MQASRTGELTRAQYYDRIRSQIEHEDELINLRVVWQRFATIAPIGLPVLFIAAWLVILILLLPPGTG